MKKRWSKKEIWTIPNGMSLFRLLLIPVFLWLYCVKEAHIAALAVLALSALTDVFDGVVARKLDMVSDFGKILDPIADKLTQAALIFSLSVRYPEIWALFVIFALKEISIGIIGLIALKKTDTVNSAQWYGKLATVVFESSMAILLLFPSIPKTAADFLFLLCSAVILFSLVMYLLFFLQFLKDSKK